MGKRLKELKILKLAKERQRKGSLLTLEGLNSKEAQALVVMDVLQEIQLGRKRCNQEWYNLGITHKEKNYASQQAELSFVRMTPNSGSGQRHILAYCQKVCYCLKEVQFVCLCCSRT